MTPVVTGLRERKRGQVAVELDGRPWRVLPTDAVVRAGVAAGRLLDRSTARKLARAEKRLQLDRLSDTVRERVRLMRSALTYRDARLRGYDAAVLAGGTCLSCDLLVEDVDFYARAIRRFGAHFIDRTSLYYRIGPSLMHRPNQAPTIRDCYRRMHARYRDRHGALDFYALKGVSRLLAA